MNGSGYIPSFDFRLFEIPGFSPLQAQEFGAETIFGASDPSWFVDRSIQALRGAVGPFFQSGQESASEIRERLQRARDEADRLCKEAGGCDDAARRRAVNIFDVFRGRTVRSGGTGPIAGSDKQVSGDESLKDSKVSEWLEMIPKGSGVFLIGVVAVIFLLLFVRR